MAETKYNTREERARQFAPFDSLAGFFEMIAAVESRKAAEQESGRAGEQEVGSRK